jgi:hypothetical protein
MEISLIASKVQGVRASFGEIAQSTHLEGMLTWTLTISSSPLMQGRPEIRT